MRIATAIAARDAATQRTRDLYSRAIHHCLESAQINSEMREILDSLRKAKAPQWAISYVKGYEKAQVESLYADHLVFGAWINGRFYSTYRHRDDYYEKQGINASDYAQMTHGAPCGHYWQHNLAKPYFVSI